MLRGTAPHIRFINGFIPYAVSAAVVGVVALAVHALTRLAPLPHVSILFVAAVVATAALWGFWPSASAAVLSVAVTSFFFYEPIFSFRVADAQKLADLAVFVKVGLPVAVANAQPELMAKALWSTEASGGRGAVREFCRELLSARGEWDKVVREYVEERGG